MLCLRNKVTEGAAEACAAPLPPALRLTRRRHGRQAACVSCAFLTQSKRQWVQRAALPPENAVDRLPRSWPGRGPGGSNAEEAGKLDDR